MEGLEVPAAETATGGGGGGGRRGGREGYLGLLESEVSMGDQRDM